MSPGSPELAEAVARYGKPDSAEQASRAAEERADVLARFPVASWPALPLERYALGSVDEPVPYCVMLEYRTPYLGSIKGGSARKHIIYRPNVGGWWVAGPLDDLDPHQAWERLRHEFVQAITAAVAGDVDDFERFPLLRWGPALVTKTLAIYAPDHFLQVYSADHMRRFIRLFGGTPVPEAPSWVLNRQLKALIAADLEFGSWTQEQVLQFLYTYLDPRAGDLTVMKIAPGENGRLWTDCLAEQTIRIGFDEVADLRRFTGDDALVRTLDAVYPDKSGAYQRKLARQLLRFRDLPAGTRVVANRGTSEILGVGTVTEEGYRYDEKLPEYRHVLGVDWDTSYAQRLESPARGWITTFNNVTPQVWAAIESGRQVAAAPAGSVAASDAQLPMVVPAEAERLLAALRRKGQVIVYGPPGTGKTRLALTAALILADRASAALSGPASRGAAIRELLGEGDPSPTAASQVSVVGFHPSLGYEDFVEGYKPVPTELGGLALTLTDGLFMNICSAATKDPKRTYVLIIDEINRADLGRVLGELVTLLELDKRQDVTVRLPVSGRSFAVPRNIAIIATMNTADRSVGHLDSAIRRRFGFVPAPPDPMVLDAMVGPLNLAALLMELNDRISQHLSRDHQLGHAYLMAEDAPVDSAEALHAAFYQDVIPQLEDHALGDGELLGRLLGPELIDTRIGAVTTLDPDDLVVTLAKEFSADADSVGG